MDHPGYNNITMMKRILSMGHGVKNQVKCVINKIKEMIKTKEANKVPTQTQKQDVISNMMIQSVD